MFGPRRFPRPRGPMHRRPPVMHGPRALIHGPLPRGPRPSPWHGPLGFDEPFVPHFNEESPFHDTQEPPFYEPEPFYDTPPNEGHPFLGPPVDDWAPHPHDEFLDPHMESHRPNLDLRPPPQHRQPFQPAPGEIRMPLNRSAYNKRPFENEEFVMNNLDEGFVGADIDDSESCKFQRTGRGLPRGRHGISRVRGGGRGFNRTYVRGTTLDNHGLRNGADTEEMKQPLSNTSDKLGNKNRSVLFTLGEKIDQATASKLGLDYDEVQIALKSVKNAEKKSIFAECHQKGFPTWNTQSTRGGTSGFGGSQSAQGMGRSRGLRGSIWRNGSIGMSRNNRGIMRGNIRDRGGVSARGNKGMSGGKRRDALLSALNSTYRINDKLLNIAPKYVFSKKPDMDYAALSRDLTLYISHLKTMPKSEDNIHNIEHSKVACSNISVKYVVEELLKHEEKTMYTGVLSIGRVFLARSVGIKKEDVKRDAYRLAYELLVTKRVEDIIKLNDPGIDAIKIELLKQFGIAVSHERLTQIRDYDSSKHLMRGTIIVKESTKVADIESHLTIVAGKVRENPTSDQHQRVCCLDSYVLQAKLQPVLVIRSSTVGDVRMMSADLYINHILISTGTGKTKKDVQVNVYEAAWETFLDTPSWKIVKYFSKGDPFAVTDSNVIDICIKGTAKIGINNLRDLSSNNIAVFKTWRPMSDMLIMDWHAHAQFRKQNAFHILNLSATASGLLLEWSFEKRVHPETSRCAAGCYMKLQRESCGYAVCSSKWYARNEAAINALRKLYLTQPIIAVNPMTDFSHAIPWTKFTQDCDEWTPPAESAPPDAATEFESSKPFRYLMHLLRRSYESRDFTGVILTDACEDFRRDVNRTWVEQGHMADVASRDGHTHLCLVSSREIRAAYEAMVTANATAMRHYSILKSTDVNDMY